MTTFTIYEPKMMAKLAVLRRFATLSEANTFMLHVSNGAARLLVYSYGLINQQLSFKLCDVEPGDDCLMSLTKRDLKKLEAIDWSGPVDCMINTRDIKPCWTLTTPDTASDNGCRLALIPEKDNETRMMDDMAANRMTAVEGQITADANELFVAALRTSKTLSHDDTRLAIQCAHIEQVDDITLMVVSTDGHRLTMQTFKMTSEQPLPFSINIPGPVWSTLVNALALTKGLEQVRFDYEKRQRKDVYREGLSDERTEIQNYMMMWTMIGSFEFRFETSPDKYPDFRRVLPNKKHCVQLDMDMVKFRRLLSMHKHTVPKSLGFTMEIQEKRVILKSKCDDTEFTNSLELLNPSPYGDQSIKTGYNWKYMMDALAGNVNGSMTMLANRDDIAMCPLTIEHYEGMRICIVMPIRI